MSLDLVWETIFGKEEFISSKLLRLDDIECIMTDIKLDVKIHKSVSRMLYVTLLMYTKNEASNRVK